ncbi:MAG: hypothetical protein R3F17_05335 [Planctomycetota bacterium]
MASHPFDVYALARGARLFGDRQLAATAWKAWQAWARHVDEHGRPQSHLPGPGRRASYQCAVFWAGHASWAARALEDLQWIVDQGLHRAPAAAPRVRVFADAGLARLENADGVAWVRGAAPPANGLHGSPRAGGLLQWTLAAGGAQLSRRRFCQHDELEWTLRTGRILRLGAGRRAAAGDWRFSLWLLRNTRRRSGLLAGLREPLRFARRGWWDFAQPVASSAWYHGASLKAIEGGVEVRTRLAWRDGSPASDKPLVRRFTIDEAGLTVEDRWPEGAPGGAKRVEPARAQHLVWQAGSAR